MNKRGADALPTWFALTVVLGFGAILLLAGYWFLYGKANTVIQQIDPGAYSTLAAACEGIAFTGTFGSASYCSQLRIIDSGQNVYSTCGSPEISNLINAGDGKEPVVCTGNFNGPLVNDCNSLVRSKLGAGKTELSKPVVVLNGKDGISIKKASDCSLLGNYYVAK